MQNVQLHSTVVKKIQTDTQFSFCSLSFANTNRNKKIVLSKTLIKQISGVTYLKKFVITTNYFVITTYQLVITTYYLVITCNYDLSSFYYVITHYNDLLSRDFKNYLVITTYFLVTG